MLTISGFSKTFGKKKVFEKVNIEIEDKYIYGVVGKNGSGKTTLFNCILGMERYDGIIKHSKYPIFKNRVGYLPTELFFFSRITGIEYIAYMLHAKKIKKKTIEIQHSNFFNLPLKNYISTYSNGMKKMLAMTAIFLQQNRWFILDEPFNGVDIENNILLTQELKRLKKVNNTVLISSHILETLFDICDSIFLIKNNSIIRYPKSKYSSISKDLIS